MDGTVEVKLTDQVYGGNAIGHLEDGRAVFVRFALPGETVRVKLGEEKRGFVRGELIEVVTPSKIRIPPRCKHYGTCGGCQYQHMPYRTQLEVKKNILQDQFARIGKIENPPVEEMVPSRNEWNYRNHIQFHMTDEGKLGYIMARDTQAVMPVEECHLPEEALNEIWPRLDLEGNIPADRISLRAGSNGDGILIIESASLEIPEVEIGLELSVVHLSKSDATVLAGNGAILIEVLGRSFQVSAASFFQINTEMAGRMVDHLLANIDLHPGSTFLDVYCGVGLFSAFFASKVQRLVGIEISPSACDDFVVNLDEFENVELYQAAAEEVLPGLDIHPDVILVDPPRAGLDPKVVEAIVHLRPRTLAYVSCDPATLARDARRLIDRNYLLKQTTPFDLFPQTYHIESISLFEDIK